jgi:hypothetical protein
MKTARRKLKVVDSATNSEYAGLDQHILFGGSDGSRAIKMVS